MRLGTELLKINKIEKVNAQERNWLQCSLILYLRASGIGANVFRRF